MSVIFWTIALILFIIIEIITINLTTIWFALGCLIAIITSFLTNSIIIQIAAFITVTTICLAFTKPLADKIIKKEKTNVESVIDKKVIVLEDISNIENIGRVNIDGICWKAKSLNGEIIKKDSIVQIKKVEGVTVFVELK